MKKNVIIGDLLWYKWNKTHFRTWYYSKIIMKASGSEEDTFCILKQHQRYLCVDHSTGTGTMNKLPPPTITAPLYTAASYIPLLFHDCLAQHFSPSHCTHSFPDSLSSLCQPYGWIEAHLCKHQVDLVSAMAFLTQLLIFIFLGTFSCGSSAWQRGFPPLPLSSMFVLLPLPFFWFACSKNCCCSLLLQLLWYSHHLCGVIH